jgi:hypothetical protein
MGIYTVISPNTQNTHLYVFLVNNLIEYYNYK